MRLGTAIDVCRRFFSKIGTLGINMIFCNHITELNPFVTNISYKNAEVQQTQNLTFPSEINDQKIYLPASEDEVIPFENVAENLPVQCEAVPCQPVLCQPAPCKPVPCQQLENGSTPKRNISKVLKADWAMPVAGQ